jgi:hypothetical protein
MFLGWSAWVIVFLVFIDEMTLEIKKGRDNKFPKWNKLESIPENIEKQFMLNVMAEIIQYTVWMWVYP